MKTLFKALDEDQQRPPQPGEIVLQRQGVGRMMHAGLPMGWVRIHSSQPGGMARVGTYKDATHHSTTSEVVRRATRAELVSEIERMCREAGFEVAVSSATRASSYYDDIDRRNHPYLENDWYKVVFHYDAEGEAILNTRGNVVCEFDGGFTTEMGIAKRGYQQHKQPYLRRNKTQLELREWMAHYMSRLALEESNRPFKWVQVKNLTQ